VMGELLQGDREAIEQWEGIAGEKADGHRCSESRVSGFGCGVSGVGARNSEPETIHLRVISVWVIEMPSASLAWV
jgi:hypothetical protein